jgi:hypothetical protein
MRGLVLAMALLVLQTIPFIRRQRTGIRRVAGIACTAHGLKLGQAVSK